MPLLVGTRLPMNVELFAMPRVSELSIYAEADRLSLDRVRFRS